MEFDIEHQKKVFGLVGRDISYSFSKNHFTEKFKSLGLEDFRYDNFDIPDISELPEILKTPDLGGLNVTIPYKEDVMPHLDLLSEKAKKVGAVNAIRFTKTGKSKGYNTDVYGFKQALLPLLQPHHTRALILGTGGASKAVAYALNKLGIFYTFVSREDKPGMIDYNRINATTFDNYQIVINCTPLGTHPNISECPPLPYEYFTDKHIAFDLVYNPSETEFMKRAAQHGAVAKNGYEMLVFQAEKAWRIWNR
ncbi:shikimate dehydrogenase family protein [Flavobacterium selenitireducens]|uniref:shikimate dehydrogenase family protein n=1 Tax=Flavobacterium selenitireducens TaxID=2722704 RepID=UPI00168BDC0D|nr:shikimate dehydrogenase [Flavobacterium selenitireducens]MBD3582637.1 shikimate dehydrogenase [Flavobacterium selenitireducens]